MNRFILLNDQVRKRALEAIASAPQGFVVEVKERTRTNDQSAALHAILADIARQKEWAGKKRSVEDWKALMVSGHRVVMKEAGEVCPGLESEFVQLRKSTTAMGIKELSSLIDYVTSWCAANDVRLRAARFLSDGSP